MLKEKLFRERDWLEKCAFIGLGNKDRADDGFGLAVAAKLSQIHKDRVFSEETLDISQVLLKIIGNDNYSTIIVIDAVDFEASPGTIIFTSSINNVKKPFSSHTIPFQMIRDIIEKNKKELLFVGVQIQNLTFLEPMSSVVEQRVEDVITLLS